MESVGEFESILRLECHHSGFKSAIYCDKSVQHAIKFILYRAQRLWKPNKAFEEEFLVMEEIVSI